MRRKLGVASPPLGLGAKLPRVRTAFIKFTTKAIDILKCAAAARRESRRKSTNIPRRGHTPPDFAFLLFVFFCGSVCHRRSRAAPVFILI